MEMGESAADGATRETWEEANAEVDILSPFAQLDIPLIGQVRKKSLLKLYLYVLATVIIAVFLSTCQSNYCLFFETDIHHFSS